MPLNFCCSKLLIKLRLTLVVNILVRTLCTPLILSLANKWMKMAWLNFQRCYIILSYACSLRNWRWCNLNGFDTIAMYLLMAVVAVFFVWLMILAVNQPSTTKCHTYVYVHVRTSKTNISVMIMQVPCANCKVLSNKYR